MTQGFSSGLGRLRVALDLRHPLAYLALHPTIAFADSMSLEIDWLPLDVPTLNPPSTPSTDDDRGVRHRRFRAEAIAREIDTYAAAQGLVIREPYRSGRCDAARRAWLWMRERQPDRLVAFLVELFRGYWALELDASDPAAVADLVARSGGDAATFVAWQGVEGGAACEAAARELAELGIFQVPAFMLDGEVFYGRQHLPMLRWILEGRKGAGPI